MLCRSVFLFQKKKKIKKPHRTYLPPQPRLQHPPKPLKRNPIVPLQRPVIRRHGAPIRPRPRRRILDRPIAGEVLRHDDNLRAGERVSELERGAQPDDAGAEDDEVVRGGA